MDGEPLMSGFELVDLTPITVEYDGHPTVLETGRPIVHVVRGVQVKAVCGRVSPRLRPSFMRWDATYAEHVTRCEACLQLHPL